MPEPGPSPLDQVKLEIRFPLPDGRTLVQGPLTYNQDGLATRHNVDFLRDPRFVEACRVGMEAPGRARTSSGAFTSRCGAPPRLPCWTAISSSVAFIPASFPPR